MRIRTAFSIIVFITFGLLVLLAASIFHYTEKLEENSNRLIQALESVRAAEVLSRKLLRHNRETFLYVLNKKPEHLNKLNQSLEDYRYWSKQVEQYTQPGQEHQLLEEMNQSVDNYFSIRKELLDGNLSALEQYQITSDELDHAHQKVDQLTKFNIEEAQQLKAKNDYENSRAKLLAIIVLGASVAILIIAVLGVFYWIYRPIEQIQQSLLDYGDGNSNLRLEPSGVKEVKVMANNFNKMAELIHKRKEDQLQFLASIAHDIRNPLNSILLSSEILNSDSLDDDPNIKKELLEIITRQVSFLNRMVGDLIDTTRIEAGKLELLPIKCNLNPLVADLVKLNQFASLNHNIKLELPVASTDCICDPARISQVINNLLSNAIKYSPNGKDIEVKVYEQGDYIHIRVSDQGIGIAESEYKSIFEPFKRGKNTKDNFAGIGLGLSASRKIIEAHGGTIGVQSTLGEGSSFTVKIPSLTLTNAKHSLEDSILPPNYLN